MNERTRTPSAETNLDLANTKIDILCEELAKVAVAVGRSKDGTGFDCDWYELGNEAKEMLSAPSQAVTEGYDLLAKLRAMNNIDENGDPLPNGLPEPGWETGCAAGTRMVYRQLKEMLSALRSANPEQAVTEGQIKLIVDEYCTEHDIPRSTRWVLEEFSPLLIEELRLRSAPPSSQQQ